MKKRCGWVKQGDELYERYHDEEWGVPVFDDQTLFEFLILESAQAGLSWRTILARREGYRKVFADFDPEKVARFTPKKIERLVLNPEIIRHRGKIVAAVECAKLFLKIQKEHGSFANYVWQFVGHKPLEPKRKVLGDIPAITPEAIVMAKEFKKRGFKFFGPTICYAYMQAVGMVNDHTRDCFRFREVGKKK